MCDFYRNGIVSRNLVSSDLIMGMHELIILEATRGVHFLKFTITYSGLNRALGIFLIRFLIPNGN